MPLHRWQTEVFGFAQSIERRLPDDDPRREATALVLHAVWAVDSLHYQRDLDALSVAQNSLGHAPDTASLAHMRWATATAVTALDLCAAALGRFYCGVTDRPEYDVRSFDVGAARNPGEQRSRQARLDMLPPSGQGWVAAVTSDARYPSLQRQARNPLVHARVLRHLALGQRIGIHLGPPHDVVRVDELLQMATDLATTHVESLMATVPF